jgi:hypothetical protein
MCNLLGLRQGLTLTSNSVEQLYLTTFLWVLIKKMRQLILRTEKIIFHFGSINLNDFLSQTKVKKSIWEVASQNTCYYFHGTLYYKQQN